MAPPVKKPLLDETKQREICAILAIGGTRRVAAMYVGCSVSTIARTALRDAEFALRLQRAEADMEVFQLQNIRQASKSSWNAAAWILERRLPERYGKRSPQTIPSADLQDAFVGAMEFVNEALPNDETREQLRVQIEEYFAKLTQTAKVRKKPK
ncbi:MAG TPA: hypothetical protein VGJ26_04905 [Pirellulales bacterium]|jgi:hypothetical protein